MVTRRFVLVGGVSAAALAIAFSQSAGAQGRVTIDQFRAISARLTEKAISDLEPTMAGKLLDGIVSTGREPGLRLLLDNPQVTTGPLAEDIVAGWYSGIYYNQAGPQVGSFTGALVWNALDFTKPFGVCGGANGYWADAP
ncbi:MAG: hypothetical protein GEU95_10610 [Rhizobiales bacterium]|nr:hypothetical protein [Hyphomicrobiales bacterium]